MHSPLNREYTSPPARRGFAETRLFRPRPPMSTNGGELWTPNSPFQDHASAYSSLSPFQTGSRVPPPPPPQNTANKGDEYAADLEAIYSKQLELFKSSARQQPVSTNSDIFYQPRAVSAPTGRPPNLVIPPQHPAVGGTTPPHVGRATPLTVSLPSVGHTTPPAFGATMPLSVSLPNVGHTTPPTVGATTPLRVSSLVAPPPSAMSMSQSGDDVDLTFAFTRASDYLGERPSTSSSPHVTDECSNAMDGPQGARGATSRLAPSRKDVTSRRVVKATLAELEADAAKRRREKKHALDELATTEHTYRDQLAAFVETLQRPLRNFVESGGAVASALGGRRPPAEDVQALYNAFAPLPAEALLSISDRLISALDRRTNPYEDATVMVGDVFERIADEVNTSMCSWYDWHERADAELRRLTDKSTLLSAFVTDAANDTRCIDHQVSSLLIAPTQRLVRQMLFLERLTKTTLESHPDFGRLDTAYRKWREILEACNKVAGNHAMQRRAEALERVLDGAPLSVVVTAPGRYLTHEGSLTKIGGATVRPDYFFLFETLSATELLHTSAPDTHGRFAYKRFLKVLHVEDVELADGDDCDATPGAVRRASLFGAASKLGGSSGSHRQLFVGQVAVTAGGGPSSNDGHAATSTHGEPNASTLLLRLVASNPNDAKNGHIYTLAGARDNLLEWKSKVTKALGKNTAEWKLRFKGDIEVLGEAYASFPCNEVKDSSKSSFMWFFSGRFGGMIIRAVTGGARSGKLTWHESLRVEAIDPATIPPDSVRGDKLKRKISIHATNVFRILSVEKTLIVVSEDKDLIVELMRRHE